MLTAGSENKTSTTKADGQTTSAASVESNQPNPLVVATNGHVSDAPTANGDLLPPNLDKDHLKRLGLTTKAAKRMMANSQQDKWLNTRVTSRVVIGHYINTLEGAELMRKRCLKMAKDKELDEKIHIAAVSVYSQMMIAVARMGESLTAAAKELDDPDGSEQADKSAKASVTMNFGFPPVATAQVNDAKNGSATEIEVVPASKVG